MNEQYHPLRMCFLGGCRVAYLPTRFLNSHGAVAKLLQNTPPHFHLNNPVDKNPEQPSKKLPNTPLIRETVIGRRGGDGLWPSRWERDDVHPETSQLKTAGPMAPTRARPSPGPHGSSQEKHCRGARRGNVYTPRAAWEGIVGDSNPPPPTGLLLKDCGVHLASHFATS